MATITVTIDDQGNPTPPDISVDPGDIVSFQNSSEDIVLCVDPDLVFGAERFVIVSNQTLSLVVQPFAPAGPFVYVTRVGDLQAECKNGGRGGGEGGGSVGGDDTGDGGPD